MRASEFRSVELLREGALTHSELGKHYGRYLGMFVDKVNNNEPFELINKDKQLELGGDQVILDASSVKLILQAYFGQNKIPDADSITADSGGKIVPQTDPNKVILKTQSGAEVTIGQLRKPPEFGSAKGFNTGQIAEGALGAAVTARFIKREGEVTPDDVMKILQSLGSGEESGKNLKSNYKTNSANDTVYFNLVLPKGDYNALYGGVSKGKLHPDMQGVINSAAQYANSSAVGEAVAKIVKDKNSNSVTVDSDGASDQTGTKADLFLEIDGQTINLLSLKAGSVKQFGQGSGYTYEKLDDFFNKTFGVNVPGQYKDELEGKDPKEAFSIIHEVYSSVAQQIQGELAGDNTENEVRFVERLHRGIRFHATRDDDEVTMVVLKNTPNAPGFKELQFGPALKAAMENVDLEVDYKTPGAGSAIISVMGLPQGQGGKPQELVRTRGNFKSEGKGYVRNIVEMGPLLQTLATIERNQQVKENDPTYISTKTNINNKSVQNQQGKTRTKDQTKHIRQTDSRGTTDIYKTSSTTPQRKSSFKSHVRPDGSFTNIRKNADGTATKTKGYDSIFKHRANTLNMKDEK